MARIPSLLRETLKLLIQYLGITFASIPAGIIYVLCLRLIGNQNAALVMSISIGIFSAYLVWRALDKRILLSRAPVESTRRVATDLDKLLNELISTKLGMDPGEVTTGYRHGWRERELYLREDVELATVYGRYTLGKNARIRAERSILREKGEAFFRTLSMARSDSQSLIHR